MIKIKIKELLIMKLSIDTTDKNRLSIISGNKKHEYSNDEKTDQYLKLLEKSKFDKNKNGLKKVEVNTGPGGYTSTRISVTIANVINNLFLEKNRIFRPKYRKGDKGY